MFDEPLGALDRALRESLVVQLRQILQETHLPAIYVTHDQDEASAIADRVLLLHDGEIVRDGSVADVWAHPGSVWVAEFLGVGTILEGQAVDAQGEMNTPFGRVQIQCMDGHRAGDTVKLLARPTQDEQGSVVEGRVADVVFQRERFRVTLDGGLFVYMAAAPKIGQHVEVKLRVECLG
jgi:spermidine/putrescine transport system ATP-binding protein